MAPPACPPRLRLAQLQKEKGGEPLAIAVLEKAREVGSHSLSGAVLDPSALRQLVPDFKEQGAPLASDVHHDHVYYLTRNSKVEFPLTPPPLKNHGNYIISLSRFVKWLGGLVEAEGVDVFTGFPATEILYDGDRVVGVRTGDRGIGKHGERKSNFEPGVDIRAKVTILTDGVRGNLTKTLVKRLQLDAGKLPQLYAIGIKELWEIPQGRLAPGTVIHTLGYPLKMEEFGGAFIYAMPDGLTSIGLVAGLDYRDPMFDPHIAFQHLKQHPFVSSLLTGGHMVRYGAKALPEGGWHTIPRVYADGVLIAGDAGGFLNSLRLKGIHLAMRTGMLAAEAAFDSVRANDTSAAALRKYEALIDESDVRRELYPVRNVHQSFEHGLLAGLTYSGLSLFTGGWWIKDPMPAQAGYQRIVKLADYYRGSRPNPEVPVNPAKIDRQLTFDRLTNVHYSGTRHAEDQPSHLIVHDTDICRTKCREEYGNPCLRFCPANVYEMVDDGAGGKRLQINASNCVHCKTCDIMDPYQIIDWVPPEGGGGPNYDGNVARGYSCASAASVPDFQLTPLQRLKARVIAAMVSPLIGALGRSLTWTAEGEEHYDAVIAAGQQPILAIWHGRILLSTYHFRNRNIVVITSQNFDGEWIAGIIRRFGFGTARGSTSRGGARALVQMRRDLAAGRPVGFTVDGPRGPARVAQPGAAFLAGATGQPILPIHIEVDRCWTAKSWDRTCVPKPFSRAAVVIGAPIRVFGTTEEAVEEGRTK